MKIWGPGTSSKNEKKKYSNPTGWGPGKVSLEGLAKKEADILLSEPKIVNGRLTIDNDALAQSRGFINAMDEVNYKANNPDLYEASGGVKVIKPGTNVDMSGSPLKSAGTYDHNYATNLSSAAVNKAIYDYNNSDIKEIENIITINNSSDWLDAKTIKEHNDKISKYVNSQLLLNELGYFNSIPEDKRNLYFGTLKQIKRDIENRKNIYTNFKNINEYNSFVMNNTAELEDGLCAESVAARLKAYENNVKRINEIKEKLDNEMPPNKQEYDKLMDEKEMLEAANRTYERYGKDRDERMLRTIESKEYQQFDVGEYLQKRSQGDFAENSLDDTVTREQVRKFNEKNGGKKTKSVFSPQQNANKRAEQFGIVLQDPLSQYLSYYENNNGNLLSSVYKDSPLRNDTAISMGATGRWQYLKDEEKKYYYYLVKNDENWTALKYLNEDLRNVLMRREEVAKMENAKNRSALELFVDNIVSIPANIFGGVLAFVDDAESWASGKEIDPYSLGHQIQTEAQITRGATAYRLDEWTDNVEVLGMTVGDVYQYGMSGIDSAVGSVLMGPSYSVVMGMGASSAKSKELYEQGASNEQIAAASLLAGVTELVFEKVSIEYFLNNFVHAPTMSLKKAIAQGLVQRGIEFTEEFVTKTANTITDAVVLGSQSDWGKLLTQYKNMGYSDTDAICSAMWDIAGDSWKEGLGGFISGGTMSDVGIITNYVANKTVNSNNAILTYGSSVESVYALVDNGLAMPESSKAYKLAVKAEANLKNGKNLSGTALYNLATAIESEIETKSKTRFSELGIDKKTTKELSPIVAKAVFGEKLSSAEHSTLNNSEIATQVVKELSADRANTVWKDAIKNSRINNVAENNAVTEQGEVLQSAADGGVDNVADNTVAQQGGQVDADEGVGAVQSDSNGVAAPSVVRGADGKQYFDDGGGDEYFGDPSGDDVAHGGDEYDNVAHLTTAEGGASPQGEAIDGENSKDLQLSEPALKDIARAPTAEESIAAAISNEQLDTKQRRILDFVEQHFPEITLKFSSNMTKDGLWDPESKTLLLNTNQTVAGMYIEVLKHEFMHRLESKRLYQEFKQFLFNKDVTFGVWAKVQCKVHGIELTQNATASEAISKLTEYYHDSVKNDMAIAKKYREAFTMDGAQREMVADFFGEVMFNGKKYRTQTARALADETFITIFDESERAEFQASSMAALAEIAEYKPNIFRQIVDWVKRIILKLRGTHIKADAILADELERNIKMLEDYVKQVYNSRDTKKAAENGGEVKFSSIKNQHTIDLSNDNELSKRIGKKTGSEKYKEIQTYILEILEEQPITLSDGRNAVVDNSDAQHIARGAGNKKISQISSIKRIVENAKLVAEEKSTKKRKFDYFYYYEATVKFGKDTYQIYLNVGRARNDALYHIYDITQKLRDTAHRINDVGRPVGNAVEAVSLNKSISNPDEIVNTEKNNDNNNDSSNGNQNPSFAVTSQMQQLRYNPEAYAKYILRRYGSKADQSEIAALVRQVVTESNKGKKTVDFNAEGEVEYTATHTRLINELSRKIADGIKPPVADYAQDVLDEIRDDAISLDERQKAEIEYEFGSLKEFKRQTGVKISEDGLPLDIKWQQWADQIPNVFEAETTSPDMPSRLADIVEKMKSSTDEVDVAAVSQQIANEIQHTLDNTGSKATNRRIAEARKEGVAQGKEIERKRSDKIITNQQTIIGKYRAKLKTIEKETLEKERERREQSEDRASNRRAIERNLRHLDHLLRSNTNARHIPEQLNDVIRKICKLFLDNSSTVFLSEEIKDIRAYYGEYVISEGLKDDMVSNDILTMFELLKSELVGKTLNRVSDEGMEIIRFVTDYFNNLVNDENKAFINGKKEDMAVLGQAAFYAIENKKVLKTLGALKSEKAEMVREFLYEGNMLPYYLFKRLGEPFMRIFNDLIEGQNRATQNMDIAAAKFEEIKQKHNYKDWKNEIFEHTTERGVKLTLTVEQLLQIFATAKREQSNKVQRARHLLGGIVLDTKAINESVKAKKAEIKKKKLSDKDIEVTESDMRRLRSKAIKLSGKDIVDLSAMLSDEQRAYADDVVEFLSTWGAALGNEVTVQLYGYRKYNDRYYITYVPAQEFLEFNVLKGEQKLMKSPSFSKSLQKKANNPLLIQGFSQVAANHIDTMCGYNGTAVAIDTLNKMLNHNNLNTIKGEEGEVAQAESVWAAIDRVYGSGMVNVLENFIADVNNGITADKKYNFFNKWFRTFKKTAVMANLSVAFQQPMAIVKTALLMNPKYLFTKVKNKSELWAECCLYAPIASLKQHGQFHGEGGTHNTEWILGNDLDTIGEKVKDLFAKDSKTRDDYLGKLAEKGDQAAWLRIWAAVKAEIADKGKYDTKSKEYLEACGERFTEIIVRTQVYDSVLSRSQNLRDKGLIGSMTAFMMEPTYALNIVGDAVIEYAENPSKNNAKKLLRTAIVMTSTELAVAIAKSFITAMRDDDDEDETYLEKYVEAVTANFISGMNPISKVPFLADIYSNIEGYTTERADMQVISDLVTALEGLSSEQKTTQEKIVNVVGAVSNLFGVPAKNVYRDIKGLVNTITSFADFEMPKGSEIVESFKKGAGESFAIVGGIKEFVEYTFNSIEMSGYLSDVKGNATYDSFDDVNKKKVEDGVSDYLKSNEKFEKGELRSKSKTFESLYEMRRKYGSTSKKYRKERKKLIDSGIDEKDLELGLEIAKFKYLEQNGITVAEYYAAKTELNRKDGEDKVYDTDGSGGLNKKETKAAIKKMKGFDKDEKDILFDILKP